MIPVAGDLRGRVLARLTEIPSGSVCSYGDLAAAAGSPGAARQVGHVLAGLAASPPEDLPWHRVINAQGRLSTGRVGLGELQRALLEAEGVVFDASGRCDLARRRHPFS